VTVGGNAIPPPPSVSSISPTSGPSSGGTTIAIAGANFQQGATVTVGGKAATGVAVVSDQQITAVTPAHVAGIVDVQVKNPDNQRGALLDAFTYVADPAPSVTLVAPSTGSTSGGTDVVISGVNFLSGATVLFGGALATNVAVDSLNQIRATTPAHPIGLVDVIVRNPDSQTGTSANAFTFEPAPAPTVQSLSPSSGPSAGRTTVTITGANFMSGVTVLFGGVVATSLQLISPTEIRAVTPARAAGLVDVTVRNPDNQSATLARSFGFIAPPTASSVSPNKGSTAGGSSITIVGANFQAGATVEIGGTAASSANVISATQINATAPPHAAGTFDIRVTNQDGQSAVLARSFTYIVPSIVTSVTPNSGPTIGGTTVNIQGTNFQAGATVNFGGVAAASVVVNSPTSITAVTSVHSAGPVDVAVTNPDTSTGALSNGFMFVSPPSVTAVAPNRGPVAGGTSATVSGTGFVSGASVRFAGTLASSVSFVSGTQLTAVTPAGSAGAATVQVTNPDTQTGSVVGGFTYEQLAAPVVAGVTPNSGPTAGGTLVTISGAGFVSGATVRFGTTLATSVSFVNATQLIATSPAGPAGDVAVQVTNLDGQSGSLASAFTYVPAPTVSSVSPNNGSLGGGTPITITGTGFRAGATVTVGGNPATSVNFVSTTTLTAVTPAGSAGAAAVQVTNPDAQSGALAGGFTYTTAPTVTSISPNSGPTAGGTAVTITGTGFQSGATVQFDTASATSVVFVNATTITAVTPAHTAGTANVTVRNPDTQQGTLAAGFTYFAPPTVSSVSPSSGPTAGGTPITITGTGFRAGATVTLGGNSATSVVVVNATTITATTPTGAGTVSVQVTNTDTQSGSLASAFTYLPPPTVSSVSPNSGPTAGGTSITITGTNFRAGATVTVGGNPATSVVVVNATRITATTPAGAGTVSVQVTNTDTQSGSLASAFIYVPPPAVGSVVPNFGPLAGGTPITITGTGFRAGATVTVGGNPATSVNFVSATTLTAVTPAGSAGAANVQVTNTDAQSGSLAGGFTYLAPPTVTLVSPATGDGAGGTSVTVTGTNFQPGATVQFNNSPSTSVVFVNSTTLTAITPPHGAGVVNVTVFNPDGQQGTLAGGFTYTLAAPGPTVTSVSPSSGPTSGGTVVTVNGTGFQSGATVFFGGTAATLTVFVNSTQLTATTLAEAAGTVSVTVRNPDNLTGTLIASFTFFAPPTVSSVSPNNGPAGGGTSITITGTGFQAGATVTVGGNPATSVVVVNANQITATTPAGAGTVSVQVTNTDAQSGSLASAFTYVPPPTVSSVSSNSGPVAGGTPITITGTGFRAGATVKVGGTSATSVNFVSATTLTAVTPAGSAGTAAVQVTNPDAQSGSLAGGFTYVAAPTVTSISPNSGATAGGTAVTITGTGFQSGATVQFDTASATSVVFVNATTLTAVTPAHTAGTANVTVRNPDAQQGTLAAGFTYFAPPTVSSVSPTSGPTAGGTSITITGTAFRAGATVKVGGNSATSVVVVNATTITATTPAGAGTVSVQVTNTDAQSGSLASAFTYIPPPTVSSVSPNSGPTAGGGTSITITGTGFRAGATVTVGGNPATSVVVVNATRITATTPAGAGTVSVQVTNTDTQSGSLASAFTYVPPPTVTSASPNSGPTAGGTSVTLTGTGFQAGATVRFGSASAASLVVVSSTQIRAVSPAGAAGAVNLVVQNPDGQSATQVNGFTYVAPPTISTVSPASGPTAGGTTTTVTGTGFQPGAVVSFGGTAAASVTFNSALQLTAVTAPRAAGTVGVTVQNPDNQSATRANSFTFVAPPVVSSVTPSSGPLAGGTQVIIAGAGFQPGATVRFGSNTALSIGVDSPTQITAQTPPGAAGSVDVRVTNPDTQFGVLARGFTYSPAPQVSGASPNNGPVAGNIQVTVAGQNFDPLARAFFGGVQAASTALPTTPTQLVVTAPPHSAGVADVQVVNSDGQSGTRSNAYTYNSLPTISSVSPASGPTAGGTSVTIIGTNFLTGALVFFGAIQAPTATVNSATQITAVTPAQSPGTVSVSVLNPDGQSAMRSNAFSYTVTAPAPTLGSVSPDSGPDTGGTTILINGTNFQAGATVQLGGSPATSVVLVSTSQIQAVTPAHADGAVDVVVANPDAQSATLAAGFAYSLTQPLGTTPPQFVRLMTCSDAQKNCQVFASPNVPEPALLTPYTDPTFGTKIIRVSVPAAAGNVGNLMVPSYSPNQAFNADGTLLLLYSGNGFWHLLDGKTYAYKRKMDNVAFCYDGTDSNARWDDNDPDKIWYTCLNRLTTYSVASNSSTVYHVFGTVGTQDATTKYVKMSDYCNYSEGNRRVAFRIVDGGGRVLSIFSFDVSSKTVLASKDLFTELPIPGAPLNKTPASACISPSGNYVYVEWNTVKSLVPDHWGTEVYDAATLTFQRRITTHDILQHSDVGYDASGDEVYIMQGNFFTSADYITYTSIRLRDGFVVKNKMPDGFYGNIPLGIVNNWHVSMRALGLPGWALISTFAEPAQSTPDIPGVAVPLQAEIFALKLDGSGEVRRIAHVQTIRNDYFAEPHATVNRQFTKIVFGSNWRNTAPPSPGSIKAFVIELQ
jgi:hypothetical protein